MFFGIIKSLFHEFYVQPMIQVYFETIALVFCWTIAMFLLREKVRKVISVIGTIMSVALIISFTMLVRDIGTVHKLCLVPFSTFEKAKIQPELYRAMFMNVLLFVPLGLSLTYALPKKCKHKILLTLLVGIVISLAVEAFQLIFALGECETDDVIMNVLGVVIGVMSYLVFQIKTKNKPIQV